MAQGENITGKRVEEADQIPFDQAAVTKAIEGTVIGPEPDDDPVEPDDNLTMRQRRFCEFYVGKCNFNATQAAREAGYRDSTNSTIRTTANENLSRPYIQRYIAKLLAKNRDGEWAHNRARELAGVSMADFISIDDNGKVLLDLVKARNAAALGSIKKLKAKVLPGNEGAAEVLDISIELYDPQPSIALLLKMSGKFNDLGTPEQPITVKLVRAGLLDKLPSPKEKSNDLARAPENP